MPYSTLRVASLASLASLAFPAFSVAVGALATLGCSQAPQADAIGATPAVTAAPESAPVKALALPPLAKKKFGAAITESTSVPLDGILQEPAKYQTKTIRTEGTVTAVCKAMGCWMEIGAPGGGTSQAHIKMAGHSFFVPKDASGHHAIVQGKVLPVSNDECSEEAKAQTGAVAKIELEATGVEFID